MASKTKSNIVVSAETLVAGTAKHLTGATPITLHGVGYTPAQITTALGTVVSLRGDVNTAKATAKAKVAAEAAAMPALRGLMTAFETYIEATFGGSPDVLADFGIVPKARAAPTVPTKAVALAKRAATRAARHTMGPVQKKSVKGNVTGLSVTPIVSAPVAPTAPAPSGPTAPANGAGGAPTAPHAS